MPDDASRTPPAIQTFDPATGQPGKTYRGHTVEEAKAIVADVRKAWEGWRGGATSPCVRR
ncbi:MAG: hypothetical protein WDN45_02365 [Caulobacteraceae bacterium]